MEKTVIVIQGPTAIGKSNLAVQVARAFGTEIISADSRQIFKEMRVGTARPSEDELQGVPHHLLGHKSIQDSYTAEDFAREANVALAGIMKDKDIAVVVGGSGFYVQALIHGMDDIPEIPDLVREKLIWTFKEKGIKHLQNELEIADPEYFNKVDLNNPQRLIRALEVIKHTGQPFSFFHTRKPSDFPYRLINIALNIDREKIYERINKRVDQMIADGLEEEARSLLDYRNLNALQTVGYNEFFEYFDGNISREQCISDIKTNTRRFAKRQLTWLRRYEDIQWIDLDKQFDIIALIKDQLP